MPVLAGVGLGTDVPSSLSIGDGPDFPFSRACSYSSNNQEELPASQAFLLALLSGQPQSLLIGAGSGGGQGNLGRQLPLSRRLPAPRPPAPVPYKKHEAGKPAVRTTARHSVPTRPSDRLPGVNDRAPQ